MTPEDIDQAVAKGIITPGQAMELRTDAARQDPGVEEEPFAFVDNFGAVFVVVGLVILQGAPWLFSTVLGGLIAPLLYAGFAAIYWVLAEAFVRSKRRLPATTSTLLFVYDGAIAAQLMTGQILGAGNEFSQFAADQTGFLTFPRRRPDTLPASTFGPGSCPLDRCSGARSFKCADALDHEWMWSGGDLDRHRARS